MTAAITTRRRKHNCCRGHYFLHDGSNCRSILEIKVHTTAGLSILAYDRLIYADIGILEYSMSEIYITTTKRYRQIRYLDIHRNEISKKDRQTGYLEVQQIEIAKCVSWHMID
jgi:hypothetical protein